MIKNKSKAEKTTNNDWYFKILDQDRKKRNTAVFYKTQAFRKLWNSVQGLILKESFREKIKGLRAKYKIPKNGFPISDKAWTHPPKEWALYESDYFKRSHSMVMIRKDIKNLCPDGFPEKDFVPILEDYLFYNHLLLSPKPNSHNLVYVTDLKTKLDSLGRKLTDNDIATYPAAILISPYAGERDILDFVKKLYKTEIEPIQKKYKNPDSLIGKLKKRNKIKKTRNQFIYENRYLPYKKLAHLVNKNFSGHQVDEGSVGKIISLEKKRRE